ncbi:hypothetical protein WR25_16930 [Diploscapter pachys]|uniref:Uncharacterized protein n=1 Tax=Diploscapter pachys TaxID=2018661 RepID=A0A2A2K5I0_9BILA|nr:hypothetical protein WR25_16930 [Diploscapter pachys]
MAACTLDHRLVRLCHQALQAGARLHPAHHRRQLDTLQVPHPQRLISRHHHFGLLHPTITQHRAALHPHRLPVCRRVQRLRIRPASAASPERLRATLRFLGVEVAPDPGETQEQLFDPRLMETLRQGRLPGPLQQGIDHHGRLQRRGQGLEDAIARQRIDRHRRIANPQPIRTCAVADKNRGAAACMHLGRGKGLLAKQLRHQRRATAAPGTRHLPVAAAIGQPRHPGPAVVQALHCRGQRAGLGLPEVEQADGFRPAQATFAQRGLTTTGLDQEIAVQGAPVVQLDPVPLPLFHLSHTPFDELDTSTIQVITQCLVEALAIQQPLLVRLQPLAVPVHLPRGRRGRFGQGSAQARMAQALQHTLRNTFHRGETAPVGHHGDGVAHPPQTQGSSGPRRADERRMLLQPVQQCLPRHAGLLAQEGRHPSSERGTGQTGAGHPGGANRRAEVGLRSVQPRPLPSGAAGIASDANNPGITGWIHRLAPRRTGGAQQHASGHGLGAGQAQHRAILAQAQAQVDHGRARFHQPQQASGHLQGAGAALPGEHLGQQHRLVAGLGPQPRQHRAAVAQGIRQRLALAQHAVLKPEAPRAEQAIGLLRRAATVDHANTRVSGHGRRAPCCAIARHAVPGASRHRRGSRHDG